MRKKYLSALLFGALLVTSAGTFTSCKDYDDDINNLQEQIDKVVSDLESLKTTVEGLGGYVTNVKVEGGKLIVTADGKDISYDLPAGAEMEEIKIENDHLYVGDKDLGQVTGEVTVKDGVLMIGGEEAGLKVGTEVIIKDSSNGMYTIQIGDETIQLPMASAAINSVELVPPTAWGTKIYGAFSETGENEILASGAADNYKGIHWLAAENDIEWDGPLGDVKAGDLLVGGISTLDVKVNPATFDLGSAKLSLVDTEGNTAEVSVYATNKLSEGPATGSRAASKDGKWTLSVKPTDKATADNFGTLYTYKGNNVMYALAVDGKVVSGYDFVVDTYEGAKGFTKDASVGNLKDAKGTALQTSTNKLSNGKHTFTYEEVDCADAYMVFEGTNVEKAKKYGVEVNGLTINISEEFGASNQTIDATLYVLNVTGEKKSCTVTFSGTSTTVEDVITAEKTTYKVAYKNDNSLKDIVVDFGTIITANMTNDEIEDIDNSKTSFAIADDKGSSFITAISNINTTKFKVGNNGFNGSTNSYAQITSLNITVPISEIQDGAKNGSYTLVMTVKDSNGNEIKKFNFPIDITLPTFDELFTKTTKWGEDGTLGLRLNVDTQDKPRVNFTQAFTASTGVATSEITYTIDNVNNKPVAEASVSGIVPLILDNITNSDKTLAVKTLNVNASYNIAGKAGLNIKTSFTTNIKAAFEDAKVVYYVDNSPKDIALVGANDQIIALTGNGGSGANQYQGLAVVLGDYVKAIKSNEVLDGLTIEWKESDSAATAPNKVAFVNPVVTGLSGINASMSNGAVTVSTMQSNDKATLTFTFTDYSGIVVKRSIAIEKK